MNAFVFLLAQILISADPAPTHEEIALLVFPEIADWTLVKPLPRAPEKLLRAIEGDLKASFLASEHAKNLSDDGIESLGSCSFIARAFTAEYQTPESFYLHDFTGDGIDDVLFTGSAGCREGEFTVLWRGGPKGYAIDSAASGLALRIKDGQEIVMALVSPGCCADLIDRYFKKTKNPPEDVVGVKQGTRIPRTTPRVFEVFVSNVEMALRSSPEVDDAYLEGASEREGQAVFGNVLSRYLPGASGLVIVRMMAADQKEWCFGKVDESSDRLRLTFPYLARLGWFECAAVTSSPDAGLPTGVWSEK